MNRASKWFFVIVAAQVIFLLGWAGYHEVVRQRAPVIVLKGRPVDPQDLLRGDYMTIGYDISSIPVASGEAPGGKETGSDVWVLLERRESYHVALRASHDRLQPGPGQLLVRGTLGHDWRRGSDASRIDYGIERFFVPEGQGSPRFKAMEVEVSVSPAHRLYIKRVVLDGKAYP